MSHHPNPEAVLRSYVAAVEARDEPAIRELFADDARWTLHAGDLPISGTWIGRDEILDSFLTKAMAHYRPDSVALEITSLLAQDERVVLEWTSRARTVDDRPYENDCIGVFTVRDGRIHTVREYMDTLYVSEVLFAQAPQP